MNHLINTIAKISQTGVRTNDDIIDRISHRHTVIILFISTLVVTTTQYLGNPIHCWCPAYFTDNHAKYANSLCWISNTYNIQEEMPPGQKAAINRYINYYQWVPVALLVQAALFHLPCIFWRIFASQSGININNLVEAARTIQNTMFPERREKTIQYMVRHLDHYLDYQRDYRGGCCDDALLSKKSKWFVSGNRLGNYLVALYMTTKMLYITNAVVQFFILDSFLGGGYSFYGVQAIKDLVARHPWAGLRPFPHITICDFEIPQIEASTHHTVKCVLPINFFTDKFYLFLWYWLIFIGLVSFASLASWSWKQLFEHNRFHYVSKHLKIMDRVTSGSDRDHNMSYKFTKHYLRQDGIFVLKLLAKNSTDLVVADIVAALWDNYRTKPGNETGSVDVDREICGQMDNNADMCT